MLVKAFPLMATIIQFIKQLIRLLLIVIVLVGDKKITLFLQKILLKNTKTGKRRKNESRKKERGRKREINPVDGKSKMEKMT